MQLKLIFVLCAVIFVSSCNTPDPVHPITRGMQLSADGLSHIQSAMKEVQAHKANVQSIYLTLSDSEKAEVPMQVLPVVIGQIDVATSAAWNSAGMGGDISALLTLVFFQISEDASSDLNELMNEMQANTEKKKALRDEISKLKLSADKVKEAIRLAYGSAKRVGGAPVKRTIHAFLSVASGEPAQMSFDTGRGGDFSVAVACDFTSARQYAGAVTAEVVDTFSKNVLASKVVDINATSMNLTLASTISAVTVRLTLAGVGPRAIPCDLTVDLQNSYVPPAVTISANNAVAVQRNASELKSKLLQWSDTIDSGLSGESQARQQAMMAIQKFLVRGANRYGGYTGATIDEIEALAQDFDDQKDSLGEMTGEDQLQLQEMMDKKAQLEAALSNVMTSVSEAENNIISNLKAN